MPGGMAAEGDAEDEVLDDGGGVCGEGVGGDVVEEEGGVHCSAIWGNERLLEKAGLMGAVWGGRGGTNGSMRTCPGRVLGCRFSMLHWLACRLLCCRGFFGRRIRR